MLNVPDLAKDCIAHCSSFEHVYLFGSILDPDRESNDIDVLLIYKEFSDRLREDLRLFIGKLESFTGLIVDTTVLSIKEEEDTAFLSRINQRYLRIK